MYPILILNRNINYIKNTEFQILRHFLFDPKLCKSSANIYDIKTMFNRKGKKTLGKKFILKVMLFMIDLLYDFYSAKLGLSQLS